MLFHGLGQLGGTDAQLLGRHCIPRTIYPELSRDAGEAWGKSGPPSSLATAIELVQSVAQGQLVTAAAVVLWVATEARHALVVHIANEQQQFLAPGNKQQVPLADGVRLEKPQRMLCLGKGYDVARSVARFIGWWAGGTFCRMIQPGIGNVGMNGGRGQNAGRAD